MMYKYPHFDGVDYIPGFDNQRLGTQLDNIKGLMLDGRWRTLQEIDDLLEYPQASISAALRALRNNKHGGYQVDRRRRGNKHKGLFEYRVLERQDENGQLCLGLK